MIPESSNFSSEDGQRAERADRAGHHREPQPYNESQKEANTHNTRCPPAGCGQRLGAAAFRTICGRSLVLQIFGHKQTIGDA